MIFILRSLGTLLACITVPCFAASNYFSKISPISKSLQKQMQLYTWHSGCPVDISDLDYLKLSYWGFDNKPHIGNLIVNKKISSEVVTIFHELYRTHFPIAKMILIEKFHGDDNASMAANNTSAFNCRAATGGDVFSKHAYGLAIDINPLYNPYVKGSVVLPDNATPYLNRNLNLPGMINHASIAYQTFKKLGWTWGGDWQSLKDYQHFEKDNI